MIDPWSAPPPGERGLTYLRRRAVECVQGGVTAPSCIARRLRISRNHAAVLLCQLRKRGIDVAKVKTMKEAHVLQVRLTDEQKNAIEKQAYRRGLTAQTLAQVVLGTVIRDRLYDAVIDGDDHD